MLDGLQFYDIYDPVFDVDAAWLPDFSRGERFEFMCIEYLLLKHSIDPNLKIRENRSDLWTVVMVMNIDQEICILGTV